jgi:putative membrane protein
MKRNKLLILCLTGGILFTACNPNAGSDDENSTDSAIAVNKQREGNDANKVTEEDAAFTVRAADLGLAQVELGKLALTKPVSPKIKSFAQMIITKYNEDNKNLSVLAGAKNITLPGTASEEYKDKLEELNEETGKDFEQDFLDRILAEDQKAIEYYKKASEEAHDIDIKAYAAKLLPDLVSQKERTETVIRSMKK